MKAYYRINRRTGIGLLYNYKAFEELPPPGWKCPTQGDWEELRDYVDTNPQGDNNAGLHLKARWAWDISGVGHLAGEDTYGFTMLRSGERSWAGAVNRVGATVHAVPPIPEGHTFIVFSNDSDVLTISLHETEAYKNKYSALRFLKNDSELPSGNIVYDYEGNGYRCVKIGNQVWTAENWRSFKTNTGVNITVHSYWDDFPPGGSQEENPGIIILWDKVKLI